jgi:hypothetical protein
MDVYCAFDTDFCCCSCCYYCCGWLSRLFRTACYSALYEVQSKWKRRAPVLQATELGFASQLLGNGGACRQARGPSDRSPAFAAAAAAADLGAKQQGSKLEHARAMAVLPSTVLLQSEQPQEQLAAALSRCGTAAAVNFNPCNAGWQLVGVGASS